MKLYFAYGANLNISSMRNRCPDAVAIQPFSLEGYRLAFSSVATIIADEHARVPGALWAISDEDEASLDTFEGFPTMYRKEVIKQDGLEFMVYVMNSEEPWEPSRGYIETISKGYKDWGLAFEDLDLAIQRTLWEIDYDLQWSTTDRFRLDTNMEELLRIPAGHGLRHASDGWYAYYDPKTLQ